MNFFSTTGRYMKAKHGTVTREKLIEFYVNDPRASMKDAAERLGVHRATIVNAMNRYGLQAKPRGAIPEKEIAELSDKEWLAEQLSTKTFRQLAKELGTSVGRIADRAYRHGISSPSMDKSKAVRDALKKRYPDGQWGENASHWKGGRRETGHGYIYIYAPEHPNAINTGYVLEHRLVMEEKLGRYLREDEIVHHINGVRSDNRIENLEAKNNGDHISEHFKAGHEVTTHRIESVGMKSEIERLKAERDEYKEAYMKLLTEQLAKKKQE